MKLMINQSMVYRFIPSLHPEEPVDDETLTTVRGYCAKLNDLYSCWNNFVIQPDLIEVTVIEQKCTLYTEKNMVELISLLGLFFDLELRLSIRDSDSFYIDILKYTPICFDNIDGKEMKINDKLFIGTINYFQSDGILIDIFKDIKTQCLEVSINNKTKALILKDLKLN